MFILVLVWLKRLWLPEPSLYRRLKRTSGSQLCSARSSFRKSSGLSPLGNAT